MTQDLASALLALLALAAPLVLAWVILSRRAVMTTHAAGGASAHEACVLRAGVGQRSW